MRKYLLPILFLSLSSAWAQTEPAADVAPESLSPPESILLVGQRPGPGLWKVSKGEHTLWIFGTYSPLPDKMEWRSQQVESIIAQSQEYLQTPGAHLQVGFWRGLTLLPGLIGVQKNPDGATLHDVLPAEVYARWQPLKAKYLGKDDSIERQRPIFVAQTLYDAGLKQAGLTRGGGVLARIEGVVKQHKIKSTKTDFALDTGNMSQALSDFKKNSLADTACFDKTLSRLESDIDAMRTRANAWSKGDIEAIQKLSFPDQERECDDALLSADFVKNQPEWQNVKQRIREKWLSAAEAALANNTTSFATLRLADLLGPQSLVSALQAKGYQVDSPE